MIFLISCILLVGLAAPWTFVHMEFEPGTVLTSGPDLRVWTAACQLCSTPTRVIRHWWWIKVGVRENWLQILEPLPLLDHPLHYPVSGQVEGCLFLAHRRSFIWLGLFLSLCWRWSGTTRGVN